MPSLQQTKDQKRAAKAWTCVKEAKKQDGELAQKYGGQAKKLPVLVLINGFGQAMAFLFAKAKTHEQKRGAEARASETLYNDVSSWVVKELKVDARSILDWLMDKEATSHDYRRATSEALAFLNWLKRFAEAELPSGEGGE